MDINIRRFFARALDRVQHPTSAPSQYERKIRAELVPRDGAKWAAATMELGALICTSKNPQCDLCPVKSICEWRRLGFPESAQRPKTQAWHGTDRQCRGVIVQALRDNKSLSQSQLTELWDDQVQVEKAFKTLLADGLIETTGKKFKLAD